MSGGLAPFGQLPVLADFSAEDLADLFRRFQSPGGPEATGSLGQPVPPVAMDERQTQALERALASPQDRAALDGPSAIDRLLFDRGGLGGGRNGFSGTSGGSLPGAFEPRDAPLPPQRPSAGALMVPQPEPSTTGAVLPPRQIVGNGPGGLPGSDPNAAAARRGTDAGPTAPGRPDMGAAEALPADSFDPLTGAVTAGRPRPLGQAQPMSGWPGGQGGAGFGGASPAQAIAVGAQAARAQPGLFEKFVQGLGRPDVSDALLAFGSGLLSASVRLDGLRPREVLQRRVRRARPTSFSSSASGWSCRSTSGSRTASTRPLS
ncbi:hypothetical protein Q8W71_29810 [Methylobacterium sp. NEAU 140]|uniref:hypothetical protein n=1 Tax=Methylobacterium sp. NEAU 140 TaxID=3064945 RepID=UPI002736E484|nr:hypothetical protein [Methylobacterium sp. NEAU 140]MDP4026805.1 hypothetical protein [Methylobacterium sp. NEAU 140]